MAYSVKVLDHYENPRNVGSFGKEEEGVKLALSVLDPPTSQAKEYAEALHLCLGHIAAICDKDNIIAVAGGSRKDLIDKPLHPDVEKLMISRERFLASAGSTEQIRITADDDGSTYTAAAIAPIISGGDAIGAVMLLSRDENAVMGRAEQKTCETAASFMGKQMEN